jgi:ubiquinone/menaquinone biosynthesis C-methylase UbiE
MMIRRHKSNNNKMDLEKYWLNKFEDSAVSPLNDHEAVYFNEYSMNKRLNACLKFISAMEGAKTVLDVGFGTGVCLNAMKKRGMHVFGIDYSYNMVKRVRTKHGITNILASSVYHAPFKQQVFDIIIVQGVFQHLKIQEDAIFEMYRCLRHGGALILNTKNKKMITKQKKRDLIYTDPYSLKADFEKVGFKQIKTFPFFLFPRYLRFFEKFENFFSTYKASMYFAPEFFLIGWK